MTTQELAELFLVSLYDMAEAAPHPYFLFTMNEFVPRMGITDMSELRKALDILEEKGLIYLASTDNWGGVSAGITMDGSVFVEKGGETGIIERYRKDPASVGIVSQTDAASLIQQTVLESVSPPGPRNMQPPVPDAPDNVLDTVLAEMATTVRTEGGMDSATRADLIADIDTLRIQLLRGKKNETVIRAILDNLSAFPSLAPLARLILRLT